MSAIHSTAKIHSTAIVENGATVGAGTEIGPYSIIGANVSIGKNNKIASHVTFEGYTSIGDDNQFSQFASIGSPPQHLKFQGERTELIIGNANVVREYVTIQPGTVQGLKRTTVADKNLFMAGSHVAHDAIVGSQNVFANYACLAGHVVVGDCVTLGGLVGVHQHVRIGDLVILGAGSMVASKDVPPYCMAQGDRCHLIGVNKIGLERAGASASEVAGLRKLYRKIFLGVGRFVSRLEEAEALLNQNRTEISKFEKSLIHFLKAESKRGITSSRINVRSAPSASFEEG